MKEKKHDEGEKHMVTLTETTEIAAPFEKLEWWVDHFEEEFVKWSPLHLECELLSGGSPLFYAKSKAARFYVRAGDIHFQTGDPRRLV